MGILKIKMNLVKDLIEMIFEIWGEKEIKEIDFIIRFYLIKVKTKDIILFFPLTLFLFPPISSSSSFFPDFFYCSVLLAPSSSLLRLHRLPFQRSAERDKQFFPCIRASH